MLEFYSRVKRYIQKHEMIRRGEAVVAGVSGGADSLCLFHVLLRLSRETGFSLYVVHVHHGLRNSAGGDQLFVEALCREAEVPCTVVRADAAAMASEWGTGVEEAGRRIRYEAFEKTGAAVREKRGAQYRIAVAHHREDQAETILFHLCRGTDLRGAGGMQPVRGRLIRPLLEESRTSIEEYLREQGLTWREDETNADTGYTRNYLRHEILPRLGEGVSPASSMHIARFADACREAERYLETVTEEAMRRCLLSEEAGIVAEEAPAPEAGAVEECAADSTEPVFAEKKSSLRAVVIQDTHAGKSGGHPVLLLAALRREDPYIRSRVLYRFLAGSTGSRDLGLVHVEALRRLCEGGTDGTLSMPGGVRVLRTGGCVFIQRSPEQFPFSGKESAAEGDRPALPGEPEQLLLRQSEREGRTFPLSDGAYSCRQFTFEGDMEAIPQNLYTKWFDYDKMGMLPVFRTRQAGDRMTLSAGEGTGKRISKKVARIMLDAGIPALLRDRIVLPFCGKEALWIPGVRMGDAFKVSPQTRRILEIAVRKDSGQSG